MSTLVKTNGFPSFRNMMDNFWNNGHLFNGSLNSAAVPAVNIQENEKNYAVEVSAPGFDKQDFKITAEHGRLTISTEKKTETEHNEGRYTCQEFSRTAVYRSFALPEDVLPDDISAKYENGVLLLHLSKTPSDHQADKQIMIA